MEPGTERPDPRLIATDEEFALALRTLRARAGLSVRDVATRLARRTTDPVSSSTLGGWFSGRYLPTPRLVRTGAVSELLAVCGESEPGEVKEWLAALERVRRMPGPRPGKNQAPFRGLAPYEPEHARYFFGREELTADLVALAARPGGGPVVVVGPSGSGKSSLVRAGLIPALGRERAYRLLTPGPDPLTTLANALEVERDRLFAEPGLAATEMAGDLLVVDQFEEVFAGTVDPAERGRYVEALVAAGGTGTVVLCMRADFYASALAVAPLVPALRDRQVVVGPMDEEALRRAITEPARVANVTIEPGLVELLLRELAPTDRHDAPAHDPGTLPMLSHALLSTWESSRGRMLTIEQYRATGGIRGAVAKTADNAYLGLDTPEQREIARRMFLRLVHTEEDRADTRRRVPPDELVDAEDERATTVLERFIAARLITADTETVEITHEVLVRAWPQLRTWLDADEAWRHQHRRLAAAAAVWTQTGRDRGGLYRGALLASAAEWLTRGRGDDLSPVEREFLDASLRHRDDEAAAGRRTTRRRQQLVALAAGLLVVALAAAGYGQQARAAADREQRQAAQARAEATSRSAADAANRLRDKDVSLSMQLALAAYRIAPTPEARSSLLNATAVPAGSRVVSPAGPARSIALGGDRLVAGIDGGPVQVWTLDAAGRPGPAALIGEAGGQTAYAVALTPDGGTLATARPDGSVGLWRLADLAHPAAAATLTAGPGTALAITPDGQVLAAASADARVRLWSIADPDRPAPLGTLDGGTDPLRALVFSPDGRLLLAGGNDGTVHRWQLGSAGGPAPLPALTGPKSRIFSLAVSRDGRQLAAGTAAEHAVYLWDLTDPARTTPAGPPLTGPASWINGLSFSPDGQRLGAASSDSLVWLYDLGSRTAIDRLPHPANAVATLFRADGSLLTLSNDGTVRRWSLPGPVLTGARDSVFTVGFDQSGRRLAVGPGAGDNTVMLWDIADAEHPRRAGPAVVDGSSGDDFSGSGLLTPDGRTLAVGGTRGWLQLFQVDDAGSPRPYGTPYKASDDLIETIASTVDGHLLAVAADDNTVTLVDIADPARPRTLARVAGAEPAAMYGVAVSPDGRTVAGASRDRHVYLWDVADPQRPRLRATLGGFTDAAYTVAFTADGRVLAAGGADGTVRLWDLGTDAPTPIGAPLTGPVGYVYSLALNGRWLAAGSTDATVWLWDLTDPARPTYLATLTGPTDGVLAVAFRPDGAVLAAGGHDHTVRLWTVDPERAAAWVCAASGQSVTNAEWDRYLPGVAYAPPCRS
jgi:WD40 repeat protein